MAINKVQNVKRRYATLLKEKEPWLPHFQLIGEFIMTRKQDFQSSPNQGAFLVRELFDNTAPKACMLMGSILVGMLWPNGARSFRLVAPEGMSDTTEVKEYYEMCTRVMADRMDDSRSGLLVSLNEYMIDEVAFGTSGVGVFDTEEYPGFLCKAWNVKGMAIDEGRDGMVDTIFNEEPMTIRKAVKTYGLEALSTKSRKAFEDGRDHEIIKVLQVIEPRMDRDPSGIGNLDMPIASVHIELGADKILKESGFEEMPVKVARFYKAVGEKFGRSPGMEALANAVVLNAIWESLTVAMEKQLDPPLAVLHGSLLGAGVLDTSARAINVFNSSGGMPIDKMIAPLFTIGELNSIEKLIDKLENSIMDAFHLDRLLDLNNEARMTLGEAQIRNRIRGDSLGSLFVRQEAELFTPIIGRIFNILLSKGVLGVVRGSEEELNILTNGGVPDYIPDEIVNAMMSGKEVVKVAYISPATRMRQAEEVQGILTTYEFATMNAGVVPDIIDNIDSDRAIKKLNQLTGGTTELLRASDLVAQIREQRAQAMQRQQEVAEAREGSEIDRNSAQAEAMRQGAQQRVNR